MLEKCQPSNNLNDFVIYLFIIYILLLYMFYYVSQLTTQIYSFNHSFKFINFNCIFKCLAFQF